MLAAACLASAGAHALADNTASINLAGVQLRNATPQSRTSGGDTIDPACFYEYVVDGMVRGRGTFTILSTLFPNPTPLADVLESLSPGSSAFLSGAGASPSGGTHPVVLVNEVFTGEQVLLGTTVTISLRLVVGIDANNTAYFRVEQPVITPAALVGYLEFTSGSAVITGEPPCAADFNDDCFVDFFDLDAFIECFEGGECPPGRSADFNGDGFTDFFDFDAFVDVFETGC